MTETITTENETMKILKCARPRLYDKLVYLNDREYKIRQDKILSILEEGETSDYNISEILEMPIEEIRKILEIMLKERKVRFTTSKVINFWKAYEKTSYE